MARNDGKSAEEVFEKYWASKGKLAHLHRVTDQAEMRGRSSHLAKMARMKPQPSDYILTFLGVTQYAEVKSCSNKTSFPFSDITPTQWATAKAVAVAEGEYNFFIKNMNTGRWYLVRAENLVNLEGKSIKWEDLEKSRWHDLEEFEENECLVS